MLDVEDEVADDLGAIFGREFVRGFLGACCLGLSCGFSIHRFAMLRVFLRADEVCVCCRRKVVVLITSCFSR